MTTARNNLFRVFLMGAGLCLPLVLRAEGTVHVPAHSRTPVEVSRDQVDSAGIVEVEIGDKARVLRLPASSDFRTGNEFVVDGVRVVVKYVSKNERQPAFALGARKKTLERDRLFPEEMKIINYSGLQLYPQPGAAKPIDSLTQWTADLDSFLVLHERDPQLESLVQAFVMNYASNPPKGYHLGDQLWDNPRIFGTWKNFFEMPLYFDLRGAPKTIDGKPYLENAKRLSPEELATQPKLFAKVLRNLEYTYVGFKVLIEEGEFKDEASALAEVTCSRRTYLTLRLLKQGQLLLQRLNKN